MRIALLSTLERSAGEGSPRRAFLPLVGRAVVARQFDLAHEMGCESLVCLAEGIGPEMLALQHLAERSGVKFQVIRGIPGLSSLVSASDEVLVFADGLAPDPATVRGALVRPGVLVLPAESGTAAGFERIDRDFAWAGVALVRGAAVERLAELAPDANPMSGLMRVAMQSAAHTHGIDPELLADHRWGLVIDKEAAREFGDAWLRRHAPARRWTSPFGALADRLARRLAPNTLGRRAIAPAVAAGGLALAGLGLLLAWSASLPAGLAAIALGAFVNTTGLALTAIDRAGRPSGAFAGRWGAISLLLLDAAIVGAAAMPQEARESTVFAALVAIAAIRLLPKLSGAAWHAALLDRAVVALVLAIAAATERLTVGLQLIALIALIVALLVSGALRLTRA